MLKAIAPVAALLLSVALLLTGNGLQGTLLPIRGQLESFSTLSIGLLGSFYFVGFGAGCILGARLVRRVGHIRTFAAMAAIASAVPLVHALAPFAGPWWLMRFVTGFSFAVLYIVIESWLNERATNESRGVVLATYQIINLTVLTVGQMMVTLADPRGFALFAVTSVLVSIASVPVALTASSAPAPIQSVKIRVMRIYRVSPLGFAGCLAVGLANGAWWSLAPVYAADTGLGVSGIAILMSATVLGGAAGQWPVGRLSDRIDRRHVLAGTCLVAALMGVVLSATGDAPAQAVYALGFAWGTVAFCVYAISMAHANDFAEPGQFVELSSGLLLIYAAGAVVGPIVASGLMTWLGGGGLFLFTALVHAGFTVFALWRMRQRPTVAAVDHVPFAESLAAVTTVSPVFDAEIQAARVEDGTAGPGDR